MWRKSTLCLFVKGHLFQWSKNTNITNHFCFGKENHSWAIKICNPKAPRRRYRLVYWVSPLSIWPISEEGRLTYVRHTNFSCVFRNVLTWCRPWTTAISFWNTRHLWVHALANVINTSKNWQAIILNSCFKGLLISRHKLQSLLPISISLEPNQGNLNEHTMLYQVNLRS